MPIRVAWECIWIGEAICWLFYGWKGSPKAGLVQDVVIEAGHAVKEIPTWMGLTAKWRVKCVSLTEAKRYPSRVQEARTGESKAGTSILLGMTHLPAPTLWSLSYCGSFPAMGRCAYA